MRMRKMKNRDSRMERCADLRIAEPETLKGNWRSLKPDATALWVEVGCGKGKFTAETAEANPDVLLIAVERCREAMVVAMEKAQSMGLKNVFYIDMDVANIEEIFNREEIDRLFINFPDPWPRKKNAKRRLTHRGFLDKYCRVVKCGGEVHYKTDNAPLFEFSVEEFAACGLEVKNLTRNLHENGIVGIIGYIVTAAQLLETVQQIYSGKMALNKLHGRRTGNRGGDAVFFHVIQQFINTGLGRNAVFSHISTHQFDAFIPQCGIVDTGTEKAFQIGLSTVLAQRAHTQGLLHSHWIPKGMGSLPPEPGVQHFAVQHQSVHIEENTTNGALGAPFRIVVMNGH